MKQDKSESARRILLIGIGPGGPDDLTVNAISALNAVDVFLVPDKQRGLVDLVATREEIVRRFTSGTARFVTIPDPPRDRRPADYAAEVREWHSERATRFEMTLREELGEGQTAGMLVWGDPCLYDSAIRVVEKIRSRGFLDFTYDVVPGVSSVSLLAARHRMVLNDIGGPITITTGRRLVSDVAHGCRNLVVMLDGNLECENLEGSWTIWWGCNLGTPSEELITGPLNDVLPDIRAARNRARSSRGWVMDTYLLRRTYN